MKSKATLKAAVEVFYGQNHYKVNHIPRISLKMHQEDKKMFARIRYGYDCKNVPKIAPKNCRSQK